jgi:putative phosphoribosyl transferase
LFQNREEAARLLANELVWLKCKGEEADNLSLVIFAIPRGGVVIGHVIASILGCKLDILISQKILTLQLVLLCMMVAATHLLNTQKEENIR